MTPAERVKEWQHYYGLLKTDEGKFALFAYLKQSKVAADREALRLLIQKWLAE